MATLLIEHSITDLETWRTAFDRFAERRAQGGVVGERIMQPVDDPHYVLVELDFATVDQARRFQQFLESSVWSAPASSPALVGAPKARVVETAALS